MSFHLYYPHDSIWIHFYCRNVMRTLTIEVPYNDLSFVKKLIAKMGWKSTEVKRQTSLYDPETHEYLNDKAMEAIRSLEDGFDKVFSATDTDDLIRQIQAR